jgi:hypothetical protein
VYASIGVPRDKQGILLAAALNLQKCYSSRSIILGLLRNGMSELKEVAFQGYTAR